MKKPQKSPMFGKKAAPKFPAMPMIPAKAPKPFGKPKKGK